MLTRVMVASSDSENRLLWLSRTSTNTGAVNSGRTRVACLRSAGLRVPRSTQKSIVLLKLALFVLLLGVLMLRSITSPTTKPSDLAVKSRDSAPNGQAAGQHGARPLRVQLTRARSLR